MIVNGKRIVKQKEKLAEKNSYRKREFCEER
jgi:hypothetical protein